MFVANSAVPHPNAAVDEGSRTDATGAVRARVGDFFVVCRDAERHCGEQGADSDVGSDLPEV